MTDKDKAILEAFEKWFAEQSVHNPDLYKWGALWICWQDAWQAGLSARIPEGWQLVPVEPTEEMCLEGDTGILDDCNSDEIYKAMLSAALDCGGKLKEGWK